MSKIKLIEDKIIQVVNRKKDLKPDQIKDIVEILALSILEIDNRHRRQEIINEVFKCNMENLDRAFHQLEEKSR